MRAIQAFLAIFAVTSSLTALSFLLVYAIAMSVATIGDAFGMFGVFCFMVLFAGFIGGLAAAGKELSK